MRSRLEGTGAIRCVGYGHVGDGNMHLNITSKEYDTEVRFGILILAYNKIQEVKQFHC